MYITVQVSVGKVPGLFVPVDNLPVSWGELHRGGKEGAEREKE